MAQRKLDAAAGYYRLALDLSRDVGDRGGELRALVRLGRVNSALEPDDSATLFFEHALNIARDIREPAGEMTTLYAFADFHLGRCRYHEACSLLDRVLQVADTVGDRTFQYEALLKLGQVHYKAGDYGKSSQRYTDALGLAAGLGQDARQARAHHGIAGCHEAEDEVAQAAFHWSKAIEVLDRIGLEEVREATVEEMRASLRRTTRSGAE